MKPPVRRALRLAVVAVCIPAALAFAHATVQGSSFGTAGSRPTAVDISSRPPAVLRMALPDASPTVDPAMVADDQSAQLAGLLYSGLVRLDASYHVVPDSAARWTISRDHRTYTFYLRPGLRFSNGDPVTAADFAYSITRSLSPSLGSPSAQTYLLDIQGAGAVLAGRAKSVAGIRVYGRRTIAITARWPVPYFLMELAYPNSFVLDRRVIHREGEYSWYGHPVGSGPYRLKEWAGTSEMILVPNRYFAGPTPGLGQVRVTFDPLPTDNVYRTVRHTQDVIGLCTGDKGVRGRTGVRETQMLAIDGVYMNMKQKPFNSSSVRRALTMALDDRRLVKAAFGSSVTPFTGFVPPGEIGYDPGFKELAFNPERAAMALWSAGYRSPRSFPALTLYYADDPCSPSTARLARSIAGAWHTYLKIKVDTQALTPNTLLANIQSDSLPIYLAGYQADYPDPHDWLSLQWQADALNNTVHYHNAQFDHLTKQADVSWNAQRRQTLDDRAEADLNRDAAWIPLYIPHRLVYMRPTVEGLDVTGYGLIPHDGNWADVGVLRPPLLPPHRL